MTQKMTKEVHDAQGNTILPSSQQMYELRMIYGVDGARRILADYYGIAINRYKYGITPWEAEVIKKDNPNKNSRDEMIYELVNRGVRSELVATMGGFSRQMICSIVNYARKKADGEKVI
jgi:hypothetical protein